MLARWLLITLLGGLVSGCATHSRVAGNPSTIPAPTPVPARTPTPSTDATATRSGEKPASLKAEPLHILRGGFALLSWNVENATDVTINGVPVSAQGTMQVWPKKSSQYHLTARVAGTIVESTAEVSVAGIGASPDAGGVVAFEGGPGVHSNRDDGMPERASAAMAGEKGGHGPGSAGATSGSGGNILDVERSDEQLVMATGPSGFPSGAKGGKKHAGRETLKFVRPAVDRASASAGEVSGAAEAQKSQGGFALDDLPPAKAVVSHPDPMQVDHEETVKVSVSLDLQAKLGDSSEDGLLKGQHMENSELAVKGSPFLGVEIKESPHFKVRYLGPDNQRLQSLGKDAATWAFSVTPVDAGQWKLHIVVTNYATENAAGRNLLTQDEIINVKVLPPMEMARRYVVEHWNWNWIWATIVLPIYGVVRRRYFPKDDKKDDNEDVPEKKAERASGKAKRGAA